MRDPSRPILLGRVLGAVGVRGELRLESWTEPRAQILRYQPWLLRDARGVERRAVGAHGRDAGKHLVVRLPGIDDRDAAEALRGTEVLVPRSALPPPRAGEYYWVDLEGLEVRTVDGVALGRVSHL
ncbi:16S rRNA processing protein RimM, partial [Tolypothrix campylonemoides VB511288]